MQTHVAFIVLTCCVSYAYLVLPSLALRGPILVLLCANREPLQQTGSLTSKSRLARGNVLCDQCDHNRSGREMETEPELGGLSSQFCIRCGRLLPVPDSVEEMLGKLTQLARFGLDAESRPILAGGEEE